jgi:hypothetical protein
MIPYLSKYFTSKAITAYIIVLVASSLLFLSKALPLLWIVFGLSEVLFFFYFSHRLTLRWAKYPAAILNRKLFNTAMFIRVVYVVCIYFFYKGMTGQPFEFDAADSMGYHVEASWITDLINTGNIKTYFDNTTRTGVSDYGWPFILTSIYLVSFKSILFVRLVNALLSAWMVKLIYRITKRNFGEEAGRIGGIMAMLLPTFIYYCGIHTKETVMIFILVAFIERADNLVRTRAFKFGSIMMVIFLGASLFFFRTVLAVAAWFSLFSALLFSAGSIIGSRRRVIYSSWFIIAALIIFSGTILSEIETYVQSRDLNQEQKISVISTRKGANRLAKYGNTIVFAPIMFIAPFPTLVNIETQKNTMMINGSLFTRNVYVFFVILALFMMYKKKILTKHILIIVMLISYLIILSASGYALSERFHLPAVPFLIILAGYGVTMVDKRNVKFYIPYLAMMVIIIIFWNWFKLAGR